MNPGLTRWAQWRRCFVRALIPILLIQSVAAQLPAPSSTPLPDLGDPAQASLTPAQERRIAEEIMREVRFREPTYLNDPEVEEYINALGQKLVAGGTAQNQNYQFFVLRDPSVNAFAMPGGVIGVHTGLIVTSQGESELAGVLAHEIGHVEQHHMARMLSRQGNTTALLLASILVAVLAGRNSPNAAGAVLAGGQAAAIQSQLSYSRDYEREADRVGLQILNGSGLDPQGMPDFFERMYQHTRAVENNAPTYLRTHPLTQDRISDISGRVRQMGVKPQANSVDYVLVRAKIEAQQFGAQTAIERFSARPGKTQAEQASRGYGLTQAYLAARKFAEARKALVALQALKLDSSMPLMLAADLAAAEGRPGEAAQMCHAAIARYPARQSLVYCEAEFWLAAGQAENALKAVDGPSRYNRQDYRLYLLQAKANTALGRNTPAHRALGEAYMLQGDLGGAIDQLELAQRSGGGDYIEQASIDARLRELRSYLKSEIKERER